MRRSCFSEVLQHYVSSRVSMALHAQQAILTPPVKFDVSLWRASSRVEVAPHVSFGDSSSRSCNFNRKYCS